MAEMYDSIANDWEAVLSLPIFEMFNYSLKDKLGDLRGKNILDLGCGNGRVTRYIKGLGCKSIIGVDVSSEMINKAKENEKEDPLGIEYICCGAANIGEIGQFDIVTASCLLHYSKDKGELNHICKNIYNALKEGGRFITINDSGIPEKLTYYSENAGVQAFPSHTPIKEGEMFSVRLFKGDRSVTISSYFYSKATYIESLKNVGFKDIEWADLIIPNYLLDNNGCSYFRENGNLRMLDCKKYT